MAEEGGTVLRLTRYAQLAVAAWTIVVAVGAAAFALAVEQHDSTARLNMFGTSIQELQAATKAQTTALDNLRETLADTRQALAVTNERVLFAVESLRIVQRGDDQPGMRRR